MEVLDEFIDTADNFLERIVFVSKCPELFLGIEVAPSGNVKTCGQFDIGTPGVDPDPLDEFDPNISKEGKKERNSNIHSTSLTGCELYYLLNGKAIRIQAGKSNVLESYNEETGNTTYKDSIYHTEEMVATINIFIGEKCLIGNSTFEDVKNQMMPTRIGMNQILIRLDDNGGSIQDCIIDGVIYMAEGQQKVKMAREV